MSRVGGGGLVAAHKKGFRQKREEEIEYERGGGMKETERGGWGELRE